MSPEGGMGREAPHGIVDFTAGGGWMEMPKDQLIWGRETSIFCAVSP